MKKCPRCGAENPDDKKWCTRCMKPLQENPVVGSDHDKTAEESRLSGSMGNKTYRNPEEQKTAGDKTRSHVSGFAHSDIPKNTDTPNEDKKSRLAGSIGGKKYTSKKVDEEIEHESASVTFDGKPNNRFCTNCGNPIEEDDLFCIHCGIPVPEDKADITHDDPHRGGRNIWMLIGVATVMLVLLLCALVINSGSFVRDIQTISSAEAAQYTLSANETCFMACEKNQVCFELNVENTSPESVYLYSSIDNSCIGEMSDDGQNGDSYANDQIYTCTLELIDNAVGSMSYYAQGDDLLISNEVCLYFFEKPTEKDVREMEKIRQDVKSIEDSFVNGQGFINDDSISEALKAVGMLADELYKQGKLMYYEVSESSIVFKFMNGHTYVYIPPRENVDSGSEASNMTVITMQPCLNTYSAELTKYMNLPDEAALRIDNEFPNYQYSGTDYDNTEVSLAKIKAFAPNQVILWHGHGGYSTSLHSYLLAGEDFDWNAWWWQWNYFMDSVQNRIVECSNGKVAITSKYIDKYCNDLSNCMFYLAACQSGKDNVLANSFLNKGAIAVVANSETIYTEYNLLIQNATITNMTNVDPNTNDYMTLCDALNSAKDTYGYDDEEYGNKAAVATPLIFGGKQADNFKFATYSEKMQKEPNWNTSIERNIVLVLDTSGSMNGTPITETKKAATSFINTILQEDANIGVVTYDSSAHIASDFSTIASTLTEVVEDIYIGGNTNIDDGLSTAYSMLQNTTAKKKIIVLMSDGVPNEGRVGDSLVAYADELKNEGILIYTLGFFEDLGYEKASAQALLEGIASDGCHYEVTSAEDLVFFFGDMADQINGQKYIYIRIACPVDVYVSFDGEVLNSSERNQNLRTNFGTLSFEENEDGSPDPVKILRLKESVGYEVKIFGTGYGYMDYTIGFMDGNGEYTDMRMFRNIQITSQTVIDTVAAASKETILNVDADGDGKYDVKYRAAAYGYGKEVKGSILPYVGIVVVVVVILYFALAYLTNKKKSV